MKSHYKFPDEETNVALFEFYPNMENKICIFIAIDTTTQNLGSIYNPVLTPWNQE